MIQLYDYFTTDSQDLHLSLRRAGFDSPALVCHDDGFLPDTVTSPYAYFCQMTEGIGKPLYFNQLAVPIYWEITGNNDYAEVWSYDDRKAKIFYASPKHQRLIKEVDWYDKAQKVRFTDHYNRFGWLFARTYFSPEEQITLKSYFNQEGQEVLVENHLTGDYILNWEGKVHVFSNIRAFLTFYLDLMGWDRSKIWYNSLSLPFFYSYHLAEVGQDVLFWQEELGDDLPGNMKTLLDTPNSRTKSIMVQKRSVYDKMMRLLDEKDRAKCHYLGKIYPVLRENLGRKRCLILTNSDQIENFSYLVKALPDYHFHIAALTEMSMHLMAFEQEANVQLYPNISPPRLDKLLEECDVYLDINYGGEVMSIVRKAFEQSMLVFAFEQTVHQPSLLLKEHLFDKAHPEILVSTLRTYEGQFRAKAEEQTAYFNETTERYHQLLGD